MHGEKKQCLPLVHTSEVSIGHGGHGGKLASDPHRLCIRRVNQGLYADSDGTRILEIRRHSKTAQRQHASWLPAQHVPAADAVPLLFPFNGDLCRSALGHGARTFLLQVYFFNTSGKPVPRRTITTCGYSLAPLLCIYCVVFAMIVALILISLR